MKKRQEWGKCPRCNRDIFFKTYLKKCKYCNRNIYPSKLSIEISKMIFKLFDYECIPFIERTYAGPWQLSSGAVSWTIDTTLRGQIGSQTPASEILKAYKKGKKITGYMSYSVFELDIED